MYRIITDTSANLELELLERKGIAEIPFSFSMPEKGGDALYCPDFSAFDSKAFYDAMRSGTRVTTSQITPAQYTEKMRPLLEAGQDILFIGMSSGVSGSFQAGMVAALSFAPNFPNGALSLSTLSEPRSAKGLLFCVRRNSAIRELPFLRRCTCFRTIATGCVRFSRLTTSNISVRRAGFRMQRLQSATF